MQFSNGLDSTSFKIRELESFQELSKRIIEDGIKTKPWRKYQVFLPSSTGKIRAVVGLPLHRGWNESRGFTMLKRIFPLPLPRDFTRGVKPPAYPLSPQLRVHLANVLVHVSAGCILVHDDPPKLCSSVKISRVGGIWGGNVSSRDENRVPWMVVQEAICNAQR